MTLDELIETLTAIRDSSSGDRTVILGIQPSWPLAVTLSAVVDGQDLYMDEDDDETAEAVWLAAGEGAPEGHGPYAPSGLWENE